ncbi:hypothetical protein BJY04DRAFT_218527 [Aspergillus karnatakaensis]|uniref:uncharacterized protein n=1 Tax=Aspergillus karnatakaensis TaxID=1810916 RepID=UPI003CCDACFD
MASETMSKKVSQRQKSRKRQPLEVLQGGSPKKVAIEQVSEFTLHPRHFSFPNTPSSLLQLPPSPVPPRRVPTPLKLPTQPSFHPKLTTAVKLSPLFPAASRRSVSMASRRLAFRPEAHIQTAPTLNRRVLDYELASDQDLASSQPISLIDLCTRPSYSRNKAKNLRVYHPDNAVDRTEIGLSTTIQGVDTLQPLSLRPGPSFPVQDGYEVSDDASHITPPSRFVSHGYSWQRDESGPDSIQDQAWQATLNDHHTQMNPLSYASRHETPQTRESSYISESPFLRKSDLLYSNRNTHAGDLVSATETAPVDTPHSNLYAQMLHQRECVPAASLQLYRDSFDRPHDKSPYETFRLKHRNNRTDLPEITSGLQYGAPTDNDYGHPEGYTTIRSEPTFTTTYPELLRGENRSYHDPQDVLARNSRLTSESGLSQQKQRVLKEEIFAILDNMHLGPEVDSKPALTPHSSETTEPEIDFDASDDAELMETRLNIATLLENELDQDDLEIGGDKPESQCSILNEELPVCQPEADLSDAAYEAPNASYFEDGKQTEQSDRKLEGDAKAIAARTTKPPPGFGGPDFKPPPGLSGPDFHSAPETSDFTKQTNSLQTRLREADAWFHTDGRGEKSLRRLAENIADNHVERNERLGGQPYLGRDRDCAKQTILAVGTAIINLHSYKSKEYQKHNDYFANFKDLSSHYYQSPRGGQRSYFDQPPVDPWRQHIEETALWCDID